MLRARHGSSPSTSSGREGRGLNVLCRPGGGCRDKHLVHIRGSLPFLLTRKEGKKKPVTVRCLLASAGKNLQETGFCAAPQPITSVSRNASCVFFPGSASRGEQGGRGRPPAFPNKLCQESGALSLGGNKSQRSQLFPRHSFPWKGKSAGGSLRPGWGSSRWVAPAPKGAGDKGPRAGTPPGSPTFPGAHGAAAEPEGHPSPAFAGAWSPLPPGFPRRCEAEAEPRRLPGPMGWGLPSPAWARLLLPPAPHPGKP